MINKIIVSGISVILVVAVVIASVAIIRPQDVFNNEGKLLSPQMKAIMHICQPTNYKEACNDTMASANTTDPKELVKTGILAISNAVERSLNISDGLVGKVSNGSREEMSLQDCKYLLKRGLQDIEATLSKVNESDLQMLADRAEDLRVQLSSVIAYHEMCVDGFIENSNVWSEIRNCTNWGNQLADNVLMIFMKFQDVLESFGQQVGTPKTSRRLLQHDSYPAWMSAADRKLLQSSNNGLTPNAIVAKDGSGNFKTISEAINAYPKNQQGRYVIYVKSGIYAEYVYIDQNMPNIYMYGDGASQTVVTGNRCFSNGFNTWKTATFVAEGDGFIAKAMAFENTAGPPGMQAVAIRVKSDKSAFINCRMDGYQDTLYYEGGNQFYRDCYISGTIDFLFGFGQALIQNSQIVAKLPAKNQFNVLTADGRKELGQATGLVIHNCKIFPDKALEQTKYEFPTYFGRPWKNYSRTVIMESQIEDFINPLGWTKFDAYTDISTLYYAEYANTGPGANTVGRVKWNSLHFLNRNEALQFTADAFLNGSKWIANTGAPVTPGLLK